MTEQKIVYGGKYFLESDAGARTSPSTTYKFQSEKKNE